MNGIILSLFVDETRIDVDNGATPPFWLQITHRFTECGCFPSVGATRFPAAFPALDVAWTSSPWLFRLAPGQRQSQRTIPTVLPARGGAFAPNRRLGAPVHAAPCPSDASIAISSRRSLPFEPTVWS
ncbi:hypothetical protein CGMCC3_g15328 [Colletotrichum fructicola]|nr:uncharacterized protein CGMCC3_g15328 [Colletotrichum fructicola]KAE9568602.1 hypothetical protein CGMCC3_g15328 [Colletotrichum fructicola]